MSLLDVAGLTIRYGDDVVVDGVDLYVDRGESVGLVGESGSGKSQSALAVLGLLPKRAEVRGSIEFEGRQLVGAAEATLDTIRARRIGADAKANFIIARPKPRRDSPSAGAAQTRQFIETRPSQSAPRRQQGQSLQKIGFAGAVRAGDRSGPAIEAYCRRRIGTKIGQRQARKTRAVAKDRSILLDALIAYNSLT